MYEKSLMERKIDESYNKYLNKILDSVLITSKNSEDSDKDDKIDKRPLEKIIGKEKAEKFKNYEVSPFESGAAKISRKVYSRKGNESYEEYNIINTDGIVLSDIWFLSIKNFFDGYASAAVAGKGVTFIDRLGNRINDDWYEFTSDFRNGYAIVEDFNNHYNIIDTKGNYVSDKWYLDVSHFTEGYSVVKRDDGKYNFMDKNGDLISNTWYDDACSFSNGIAMVKKGKKWNYFTKEGKPLSKKWFNSKPETFRSFGKIPNYDGIFPTYSLIAKDGSYVVKGVRRIELGNSSIGIKTQISLLSDERYWYSDNGSFVKIFFDFNEKAKIICQNVDYNGYSVNKTVLNKYSLKKGKDSFTVKGKPIKVFGSNCVLYYDDEKNENISLYNRKTDDITLIGKSYNIFYNDNLIVNETAGESCAYLIYNDNLYDITDYYFHELKPNDIKILGVKEGFNIITKDQYHYDNESRLLSEVKELKEEEKKREEEAEKIFTIRRLAIIKDIDVFSKDANEYRRQQALECLRVALEVLKECGEKDNTPTLKIDVCDLFIDCGNHREFNSKYIESGLLKYIDLSKETFVDVKMSGIDFRGCNINLNPQVIYDGDLTNCNFEGIHIPALVDYSGIDIRGSKFSSDNDPCTKDYGSSFFPLAVYDETTTFDNQSFVDLYGPCKNVKRIRKY